MHVELCLPIISAFKMSRHARIHISHHSISSTRASAALKTAKVSSLYLSLLLKVFFSRPFVYEFLLPFQLVGDFVPFKQLALQNYETPTSPTSIPSPSLSLSPRRK